MFMVMIDNKWITVKSEEDAYELLEEHGENNVEWSVSNVDYQRM